MNVSRRVRSTGSLDHACGPSRRPRLKAAERRASLLVLLPTLRIGCWNSARNLARLALALYAHYVIVAK